MASESINCNTFYSEHNNSVMSNYFPQLSGTSATTTSNNGNTSGGAGVNNNTNTNNNNNNNNANTSNNSSNNNNSSSANNNNNNNNNNNSNSKNNNNSNAGSNNVSSSGSSTTGSETGSITNSEQQQQQIVDTNAATTPNTISGLGANQWNTVSSSQQHQQTSQTQQQQQQQRSRHHHHHHHHQHQQQQQHHTPTAHHQQQQQDHLINVQNLQANTPNTHSIFTNGFHHRANNPWGLQNLAACYQRIQQQHNENLSVYSQNFHPTSVGLNHNGQLSSNNDHTSNALIAAQQQQQQQQQQHHQHQHQQQQQQQQNLKRFGLYSGKSGHSKDICNDDKFKEDGDPWNVEAQAAFLGPNLWDKTLPYDADLKVTQYADLDEFLSENNIPDGLPGTHLAHTNSLGHRSDSLGHSTGLSLGLGHVTTKRERSPSPSDCVSPDTINPPSPAESTFSFASSGRDFDPRTRAFSDEELKPQPMIKKSRKQFVPDELKDDKYWARRRKNNIAAKRSRDARRQKENQIAMRARYLEKENSTLHQEVEQLKQENMELRARLSKYQDV